MATKSLPQKSKRKRRKLPANVVVKNSRWYVRIRYKGDDGQRHAAWRECAKNPTDAREVREALRLELKQHGQQSLRNAQKTFHDLARHFRDHYLKPAKFVDGRKVSGYRSVKPLTTFLSQLEDAFGTRPLRSITYGHLVAYKDRRLDEFVTFTHEEGKGEGRRTVETKRQRSIASVNRELALLRKLFNIAVGEGWLHQNPFARGRALISQADERKRERILTSREEKALLELCTEPAEHLRPLIICAIDTGMRWGEMTKLLAGDLDFDGNTILIRGTNTKTLRARRVRMTKRVRSELEPLTADKPADDLIFDTTNVKKLWKAIRERSGMENLRWHDLRHTNATRIARSARIATTSLARQLGHDNTQTTYRYVQQDEGALDDIVSVLDEFNEAAEAEGSEAVN